MWTGLSAPEVVGPSVCGEVVGMGEVDAGLRRLTSIHVFEHNARLLACGLDVC